MCLCVAGSLVVRGAMQIMSMSTMTDVQRLALLKQIGGTNVYEERRKESLRILRETEARRSRINEVVCTLLWMSKSALSPSHKANANGCASGDL